MNVYESIGIFREISSRLGPIGRGRAGRYTVIWSLEVNLVRRCLPFYLMTLLVAAPITALDRLGPGFVLLHDHDHEGFHLHKLGDSIAFGHTEHPDHDPSIRNFYQSSSILLLPDLARIVSTKTRLVTLTESTISSVVLPICWLPNAQSILLPHAIGEFLPCIHGPPQDLMRSFTLLLI